MDAYSLITQWRKKAERALSHPEWDEKPERSAKAMARALKSCADDLEKLLKNVPVRVLRIIEYTGDRNCVETQVSNSLHGVNYPHSGLTIKAATIGSFPEILIGEATEEEKQS